jgi:hypothetical protein
MTIKRYIGDKLVGTSGDSKPTTIPDGATFYETDTLKKYIKVSGSWSQIGGGSSLGYALSDNYQGFLNPTDGQIIYINGFFSTTSMGCPIPKAGTIKQAAIRWRASGAAGTNESIDTYLGLNDSSYTSIQSIGSTDAIKIFSNTGLSISVSLGDYICWRVNCPTWATNPSAVYIYASCYIE